MLFLDTAPCPIWKANEELREYGYEDCATPSNTLRRVELRTWNNNDSNRIDHQ
jgi:hypothetical protein